MHNEAVNIKMQTAFGNIARELNLNSGTLSNVTAFYLLALAFPL